MLELPTRSGHRRVGLVSTKLMPPRERPRLVARPGLCEQLEQGRWRPLTLVCAPAGSGKTTVITQWLAQCDAQVAWLSLEDSDRSLNRFLAYVLAAVHRVRPEAGEGAAGVLATAEAIDPSVVLTEALIEPLASSDVSMVLVLDDFHAAASPEVTDALAWLLDHLPRNLHVVVTTRRVPELHLVKLRARDEVTELDAADLRFDVDAARELLSAGLSLDDEALRSTHAQVDGHAASLQLAALSLRKNPRASAKRELVSEYLASEVLGELDPRLRRFLLDVSILEHLEPELCAAVSEQPEAELLLERALEDQLFISHVDDHTYVLHDMFREVLTAALARDRPERVPELHARAAAWLDASDRVRESVAHAIASGGADFIGARAQPWMDACMRVGDYGLLGRIVDAVEPSIRERHPWLSQAEGWMAVMSADIPRARGALERSRSAKQGTDHTHLEADRAALAAMLAYREGRPQDAIDEAARAEAPAPRTSLAMAEVAAAYGHRVLGDIEASLLHGQRALAHAEAVAGPYYVAGAAGHCAQMLVRQGRLRAAESTARRGMQALADADCRLSPAAGPVLKALSDACLQRMDLDTALDYLHHARARYLAINDDLAEIEIQLAAAKIHATARSTDEAFAAIERAAALASRLERVEKVAQARALEARIAWVLGDRPLARRWLDEQPAVTGIDARWTRTMVALERGDREVVHRAITDSRDSSGGLVHAIEWGLIEVSELSDRAPAQAAERLARWVSEAEAESIRRPFVEHRETMTALAKHLPADARVWLGVSATTQVPRSPAASEVPPLLEPLSPREHEVLQLVARGLSNKEIGRALFVGVGTIKTHVHRILRKVGAKNRTEVTSRARALGLLDEAARPG